MAEGFRDLIDGFEELPDESAIERSERLEAFAASREAALFRLAEMVNAYTTSEKAKPSPAAPRKRSRFTSGRSYG